MKPAGWIPLTIGRRVPAGPAMDLATGIWMVILLQVWSKPNVDKLAGCVLTTSSVVDVAWKPLGGLLWTRA
jgi:hypothetical protein